MTRNQLKQYQALKKEIESLDHQIEKLREQAQDVPTVSGTVMSSSKDFPYIRTHVTVEMDAPQQMDAINRRILLKERRLEQAREMTVQIEQFIAGISDSTDRQIFELVFLEGKTQQEAANTIGYTQGRIAQKIKQILQD